MRLNDGIDVINNIGPARLKTLNDKGIFSVRDLIEYFPRDYEDRSVITPIYECCQQSIHTIRAEITSKFEIISYGKLKVVKVKVSDDTGVIELVWFNMPFLKNVLKEKQFYFFTGKVTERLGKLVMEVSDYELVGKNKENLSSNRIIPKYRSVGKISQKIIRGFIYEAINNLTEELVDFIDSDLLVKYNLCSRFYAIKNIHFPENNEAFYKSRYRLVFEEFLLFQLAIDNLKGQLKKETGIVIPKTELKDLLNLLGFNLTLAQDKVVKEMEMDLNSGFQVNRLVQGDVGSGKTAVALLMAYSVIKNGYQVGLMAPTEVLAVQHYNYFSGIFEKVGISVALLNGTVSRKEKLIIYDKLEKGNVDMVIGTHALIQDGVSFCKMGLAITDEQHRFGVRQRMKLSNLSIDENVKPHILVMTATPIPRTLALILYGELDISIIDQLPPGRIPIETYCVNKTYRKRIFDFIKKEVDKGRQAYIVCSSIEESEGSSELKSVISYTEELKSEITDSSIEFLHGKMKNLEKQEIMARFSNGEIDILVSTTVIEVGINVPNATVMLIENAERFGLSQLHQLRGRVGRGRDKSYCILMTDSKSKITKQRMEAMTSTNDGFKLSELDLEIRGPGDYFGTRQHGLPEFRVGNLYKDMDIFKEATKAKDEILSNQLMLNNYFNDRLKSEIERLINTDYNISL